MINPTATKLLEQQGQAMRFDQETQRDFINRSDALILVYTLNDEGYTSSPTPIATGERVPISGLSHHIWLAKTQPSGKVIATGLFDDNNEPDAETTPVTFSKSDN